MPALEPPMGRLALDGTTLAWIERGSGPLVVCQHGFPDSVWSWVPLLEVLADAGFRAVAPALRGYAPGGPAGRFISARRLAADLLALADALGAGRFSLVGHDWGALAAWALNAHAPERLERLVVASVPHPRAVASNASLRQAWRSRYMLQLQVPWLPERVVGDRQLRALARRWSPTWDVEDADLEPIVAGLGDVARRRAAFGCYRALPATLADRRLAHLPQVPTAYVHGADDACIGVEVAAWPPLEPHVITGAGHFVHLEAPEAFAAIVLDHLTAT